MFRAVLLLAVLPIAGCKPRDVDLLALTFKKTGERLGLSRGPTAGTLTGTLRGSLGETSLSARVENRLRWDAHLSGLSIEVVTSGAAVTLRGNVPDLPARSRALDLAKTTLGVESVTDEMTPPLKSGE
jgi:osmotically-inducible protein OsmY